VQVRRTQDASAGGAYASLHEINAPTTPVAIGADAGRLEDVKGAHGCGVIVEV
jgi:hypothetical protein